MIISPTAISPLNSANIQLGAGAEGVPPLNLSQGISLDGTDDYLISQLINFAIPDSYTMSIWFKTKPTPPADPGHLFTSNDDSAINFLQMIFKDPDVISVRVREKASINNLHFHDISGIGADTLYHLILRRRKAGENDFKYTSELSNNVLSWPNVFTESNSLNNAQEQDVWPYLVFGTNYALLEGRHGNIILVGFEFYDYSITDGEWESLWNNEVLATPPIIQCDFNSVDTNVTQDRKGLSHFDLVNMVANPVVAV